LEKGVSIKKGAIGIIIITVIIIIIIIIITIKDENCEPSRNGKGSNAGRFGRD
jgi:uncharacterized alpha/beta hydrolase family protein